jgi:hypothetical protein
MSDVSHGRKIELRATLCIEQGIQGGKVMDEKEFSALYKDDRDVLETLKFELDFIEKGGYGRSVRTPWQPTSTFQDSLTCLNFGDPKRSHPCDECLLMTLVPPDRRAEEVPCHHIPVTVAGKTIRELEQCGTQDEIEDALKNWLRRMIATLKDVRGTPSPTRAPGGA